MSDTDVLDWRMDTFVVSATINIASLTLDNSRQKPGGTLRATVVLSSDPLPGMRLRCDVLDNHGRCISTRTYPATREATLAAPFAESLHIYNYVNLALLDENDRVICEDRIAVVYAPENVHASVVFETGLPKSANWNGRTLSEELPWRDAIAALLADEADLKPAIGCEVASLYEDQTHRVQATEFHRYRLGLGEYVALLRHPKLRPDAAVYMSDLRPKPAWIHFGRTAHVYDVRRGMYRGKTDKVEDVVYPPVGRSCMPFFLTRCAG